MNIKEFIQKSGDEVAIVIYDAPLPPKYFRLTKRFIRNMFVVAPLFIFLLISTFFVWGLGSRLKDTPSPGLPSVITLSDDKLTILEDEIKVLQKSNQELVDKLGAGPAVATPEDPFLMLVKKPYGMQNLISQNRVVLDNFELVKGQDKINLKFQIISSVPETKVTGHIIVFMISDKGVMVYPSDANQNINQGIKYSSGEPFSVSRLRPTNAEFNQGTTGESVKFLIYIFSREGDLLLIRETDKFKLGAKS